MGKVEPIYEKMVSEFKLALREERITELEYMTLIKALHDSMFRHNEDPRIDLDHIIEKVWPIK